MEDTKVVCQSCKNIFFIQSDDFGFYEKIGVPAPTFCPECRLKRRMAWRNERALFRRNCDMCKVGVLSIYHPENKIKVFCKDCWWSDKWSAKDYAQDYDFSKSFFLQYKELFEKVPRIASFNTNNVEANFSNYVMGNKGIYFSFSSHGNQDSGYLQYSNKCRSSYDCLHVGNSDRAIGCNYCERLYNCSYLLYSYDCSGCILGRDLHNCSDCIGCVNLRNASNCVFNKQYSKEEYKKIKSEILLSSLSFQKALDNFDSLCKETPIPESYQTKCVSSVGNDLFETKNLKNVFCAKHSEDSSYVFINALNVRNCLDVNNSTPEIVEYSYECQGMSESSNMKFCDSCWNADSFCTYCSACYGSTNLFGCIGMKKNSYSILNKEYSKLEYETLLPKIIEHMNEMPYIDKKGISYAYGEFFPSELSPFSYNESINFWYFPITKKESMDRGLFWRDRDQANVAPTFDPSDDYLLSNINESQVNDIFSCAHAGNCSHQCPGVFRVIKDEIMIYKQAGIPLPTLCPNCRNFERLGQRNHFNLWDRVCACAGLKSSNEKYLNTVKHDHGDLPCLNKFKSPSSPDSQDIVYCRKCYQQEIY